MNSGRIPPLVYGLLAMVGSIAALNVPRHASKLLAEPFSLSQYVFYTLFKSIIQTYSDSTNRPANTTVFSNLGLAPLSNPFHIPGCDISLYCGPSNPEKSYPRLLVENLMNEAFTKITTELAHGGDRPVPDRYLEFEKAGVELAIRTPGVIGATGQIWYSELEDMLRGFGFKLSREGTILTRCIYYWDGRYPPVMGGVHLKGW